MKIAFLTPEYPHSRTGFAAGIGTSIMNLGKGLVGLGHEVTVVVYGQDKDEYFEEDGMSFYKIKNIKIKGLSRILTQKKIQLKLNSLVKKNKIELVEAPDWTGITSGIRLKCPLVIKLHGSDTYFCHLDGRPVKPINRLREKKALENSDAVVSVSAYTAKVTKELFDLAKNITVVPNGIDIAQFAPADEPIIDDKTLLYFGTLIRKKGLLELPLIFNEIYRRDKDAKLVLIGRDASDVLSGNPSTWNMMQPLFTDEAIHNVNYVGAVRYDQMKNHIERAAACVFPTFAEALPVSWLEAMALKKAIVASDIGWANEIIEDSVDGFLSHPKNHTLFADRVLELLDNAKLRISFGEEARKKVTDTFSVAVVARQSAEFYKGIIKERRA